MCEQFLKLVQLRRIQHAKVVPTMLSRLLSLPPETRSRYDISGLTHLIHSAAPCPPAVKRAAIDWFGPAVWEFYGCSESGPITPLTGSNIRIASAVLRMVPPLSSPTTTAPSCQQDRPLACSSNARTTGRISSISTNRLPHPGMITVGDLDHDGYLYLTGRTGDVIITGGVNIYSAEIEAAVSALPQVEDVAVFGIPRPGDLGERIAAHIIGRPGIELTETTIRVALTGQLADYTVPSIIRVVEMLPT
ncbi:AMP-binding protein [Nocardia tengchongensis]|uniref:AMP-binding protein n=1 Tax=Nocardia tengchongensis TaxID=2055889 RepID=UPI003647347F